VLVVGSYSSFLYVGGEFEYHVKQVLRESALFVFRRPKVFGPKAASSVLGSVFLVGIASGQITPRTGLLLLLPLGVVGMFSTLMVASMARSNTDSLSTAAREAAGSWKNALKAVVLVLLTSLVLSVPASVGVALYLIEGSTAAAGIGVALSVLLTAAFSAVSYFLPLTLLEEGSLRQSVESSYSGFSSRRREVWGLVLFSFALFGLALAAEGALESLGFVGFVVGRLASSAVSTYVFVVSPKLYLEEAD
jgi:cellobiose-specific phosphotransferase system component IIC